MSRTFRLNINHQTRSTSTDPERPLLDVLREDFHLTGTKYGCGEGECGACTVLVAGVPTRSCITTVGEVEDDLIETVEKAGLDPLEFRLKHLEPGRLKDVLRAAAEKFNWRQRHERRGANRGVGLACGTEKGSYVAACVEVEVADKDVRVLEVCQAFECGAIQNPDNLRAQMEGCLMMGLGGALYESIEFENGRISNPRFSDYRVPRMKDLPELDFVFIDRRDLPSVGAGETPIIAIAPAVANAVQHAVGKRCRSMPLRLS